MQFYSPALAAVFDGVMHKVCHRLAKAIPVTSDQEWPRTDYINTATVLRRDGGESLRNLLGQGNQVELSPAEWDFARL